MFSTTENKKYFEESGITVNCSRVIQKVGYCTNLTLATIEEARNHNVDLIITHHDAWEFIYGLREACSEKLQEYGIGHYYNHLPLDDCNFGTNDSLIEKLNLKIIERTHEYDGFFCGRVCEFEEEIDFSELVARLEKLLHEPVKAWKFNERKVKRVGVVCGGGGDTSLLKVAVEKECDVYITGEKVLYTIEYAQFKNMNLIIGSHTFIELFGVHSLAMKLKDKFEDLEIVRLYEDHLEA
jgi:dinuclear metal center YbgI/SA1388 family protein